MHTTSSAAMELEVFFDGDCPLCAREIRFLQKRNQAGKLMFVDISDPSFEPEKIGKTYSELMAKIHGRDRDGTWLTGVEVFRRVYDAIGFHRLVKISRTTPFSWLAQIAYTAFAKNRLRITGRGSACDTACAPRASVT